MNIILMISIVLIIVLAVKLLMYAGKKEYKGTQEAIALVNRLDALVARTDAIVYLQDKKYFSCMPSLEGIFSAELDLPKDVLSIFDKYETIQTVSGVKVVIDRKGIRKSVSHPGYTIIGNGMTGSDVEFFLAVTEGDEKIYELYNGEEPDPKFGIYTSIYHWIIANVKNV
jgi:sensor histidine kinase regulating citrate/malate metabolism